MNRKYCYALLTCSECEKENISHTLLNEHLVACAKFMPVNSAYWWQGKITNDNETAILMETAEDLFDEIEAEVAKIHSYDTFVLTCISMSRINRKAEKWLNDNLKEAK